MSAVRARYLRRVAVVVVLSLLTLPAAQVAANAHSAPPTAPGPQAPIVTGR